MEQKIQKDTANVIQATNNVSEAKSKVRRRMRGVNSGLINNTYLLFTLQLSIITLLILSLSYYVQVSRFRTVEHRHFDLILHS